MFEEFVRVLPDESSLLFYLFILPVSILTVFPLRNQLFFEDISALVDLSGDDNPKGLILHAGRGQFADILRTGIIVGIGKAMGIGKVTICHL